MDKSVGTRVASCLTVASIHAAPSRESEQVSDVLLGEVLAVSERGGDATDPWLRVIGADEYEGWLPASHVAGIDEDWSGDALGDIGQLVTMAASRDGTVRRPLVFGCRVRKLLDDADRVVVALPDGARAEVPPAAFTPFHEGAKGTGEIVARFTEAFAGVPYRWGGRSPWGVDCSGLVQLVMRALGVALPRDAYLMEAHLLPGAERVTPADSRVGDLAFFGGGERATHVAVMLDGDRFLHARDWVRVGSLSEGPDADLAARLRCVLRPETR